MTTVEPVRARLDERILGAGTNSRFALLLLLLVAASGYMLVSILTVLRLGGYQGCALAAGVDWDAAHALATATRLTGQALAFLPCVARHAPPPPLWQILAAPAVVVTAAAAVTVLLPLWKQRHGRCIRLNLVPGGSEIAARVEELAAGRVARVPELFFAPAATTRSATVFGTNGRPRLVLHGGLVACRITDPRTFDAVVLHELGHVANRDLTITYATVALWRTFIVLVIVPYLLWWSGLWLLGIAAGIGPTLTTLITRYLVVPVVIAIVMHFARADVLRSRELYADLTARRWGAPLEHVWAARPTPAGRRRPHRWASVLLDQLRTHPRWEIRRDALDDPAPLFAVSSLLMFLAGTSATLMNFHLMGHVAPHVADLSDWLGQGLAAVPAAVVAAPATAVLWRAVVRAAVLGRPAPTGVRAGLWLGLGLAAGSLVSGQVIGNLWPPGRWWVLALVVGVAVAFTCWTCQCARLAAASWPGRSLRWPLALCLIAGWLILAAWFAWWNYYGAMYASGFWYDPAGLRRTIVDWFPGMGTAHPDTTAVMAPTITVLRYAAYQPLTPVAAVAAWATPFVLWAAGAAGRGPGWPRSPGDAGADRAAADATAPVAWRAPALRQATAPALLGAVIATAGVAGVQAWLHTLHAAPGQRGGMYAFSYAIWSLWAIAAGALVAALVAASSARFRLPAALIAAGIGALLGLGAATALISADGCVQPLSVLNDSCTWRPAWRQLQGGNTFGLVAHSTLLMAPVVAVAATALAALFHLPWRAIHAKDRAPAPQPVATSAPALTGGRYAGAVLSAAGVPCVALATAAVLMAGDAEAQFATKAQLVTAAMQTAFQQTAGLPVLPVSRDMRRRQVHAWYRLGGRYLLDHATRNGRWIVTLLHSAVRDRRLEITADLMAKVRPACRNMMNVASWEPVYFQIPDPAAQASWHRFGLDVRSAGPTCLQAADHTDVDAFGTSMMGLLTAAENAIDTSIRIDAVIDDRSDPVYKGEPEEPPQPRL
ncbi:M48 family metalloprotease [Microbispora sp. KK1-11]|uniref:M48 family metalloprotease n=1 Tax=Microbispora sp. KK1-11 TaxID=2053005 RepID=UPI00115B954E|nr:M48 family metalloprotease [Microbispora sp. KK1-11]TQS31147.1 M48 family metalloprotease [Microbispora sp. KK1-11]